MRKFLLAAGVVALASLAMAQSPLTTNYLGGNGLAAGSTVFFDVVLNAPLTFVQIEVNSSSAASTSGSIDVRWCAATYVGNDTNAGAWTLGGSGPVIAAGNNLPTPCVLTPFTLPAGNYGMAVTFTGIGQNYTNGNGTVVPGSGTNQTFANAEMTLLGGASSGGAVGTAICCQPRVFNGSLYYTMSGSGTVATRTSYGSGCVTNSVSFYEHFLSTPSIDLSNSSFTLVNLGSGYLALPGLATYLAPSGAATNLNLGDDTETTVALAGTLAYPGGTTTSLNVASNGHISTASNGAAVDYTPTPVEMLAWPNTTWCVWRDMIPNATANVWFEQVGSVVYITWLNVIGYVGTSPGTTPSTFQLQFDLTTGNVSYVFQSLDTVSISTWAGGEGWIVGYSPGGPSNDPGSVDLTSAIPGTINLPNITPLTLAASARPLVGTTINLNTGNISATAPFGAVGLGFTNPAIDLTGLGMPGCTQYTDMLAVLLFLPLGSSTVSVPFTVPSALGVTVLAQSFAYDPTAALTPLGAVASNGITLGIGNL